jgi:hypothetical protein
MHNQVPLKERMWGGAHSNALSTLVGMVGHLRMKKGGGRMPNQVFLKE